MTPSPAGWRSAPGPHRRAAGPRGRRVPGLALVLGAAVALGMGPSETRGAVSSSSQEPEAETAVPQFQVETDVVTVDVLVLDKSGAPVEGLSASDFTLLDEGETRRVDRFEAIVVPESAPRDAGWPTRVSTNAETPARQERTFAVIFDDVHLAPDSAQRAKRALSEFVHELGPGDRVLLVPTSGGAWWSATLPDGRDDLVAALARLTGLRPRNMSGDRISDYEAMRLHVHQDKEVGAQVTRRYYEYRIIPEPPSGVAGSGKQFGTGETHPLVRAKAAEVYQALAARRLATCRILERVARSLEGRRGRKSILFVSEGFIEEPGRPEQKDAVFAAARANAVVHFLDARGLTGLPATADAEIADLTDLRDLGPQLDEGVRESLGAVSVAVETGGRVVKNMNDLSRGLRPIERESRAYCLLGFEPDVTARDGSFHRLSVRVSRPGVKAMARKGYYAPHPNATAPPVTPEGLDSGLRAALDSPFESGGIPLRMASYVLGPAGDEQSVLFVADVDPGALSLDRRDQRFTGRLGTCLVVSSRDTGERFHRQREVDLSLPSAILDQVRRTWLSLVRDIPLPPGTYQASLLVRDLGSGRMGTVRHDFEVPRPDGFRLSTPILTDVLQPVGGPDAPPRPTPLARRTFAPGRTLSLVLDVHGARRGAEGTTRVLCGYRVEGADGGVIATQPETELEPGPGGDLSTLYTLSLAGVAPGDYAIVVRARDERTGDAIEAREPFRVEGDGEPRTAARTSEPRRQSAPDPDRDRILAAAGRYVADYERGFSDIVAEETYTQWASGAGPRAQRRVTRADLVFVRLAGDIPWGSYRDVFEVDGHPVREREARLEKLFLRGETAASERTRAILAQSSAYNIGMAARTANIPTLPLLFLHPRKQARFVFERRGTKRISDVDTIEIRFEEVARPTLVRGNDGGDLPASGRFWIQPGRGTVLRSEVRFEYSERALASFTTEYRPVQALAMWLPSSMSERYEDLPDARARDEIPDRRFTHVPVLHRTTEAEARYSNFRRFGVSVEEEAHLPPE